MKRVILAAMSIIVMASCNKEELAIDDNNSNNSNNQNNQSNCECGTVVEVSNTYGVTSYPNGSNGPGLMTIMVDLKVRNNCSNKLENFPQEYAFNQYYVSDEYCAGFEW